MCSPTLLPMASPTVLATFLFLVFFFHTFPSTCTCVNTVDTWGVADTLSITMAHSLYHHHPHLHFYRWEQNMMLGSCSAIAQITKMLNGPTQISDLQLSVFSKSVSIFILLLQPTVLHWTASQIWDLKEAKWIALFFLVWEVLWCLLFYGHSHGPA